MSTTDTSSSSGTSEPTRSTVSAPGWTSTQSSGTAAKSKREAEAMAAPTSNEPSKRNAVLGIVFIGLALVALFAVAYPLAAVVSGQTGLEYVLRTLVAVVLVGAAVVLIKNGIALARGAKASDQEEGLSTSLLASALPALGIGAIVMAALWRLQGEILTWRPEDAAAKDPSRTWANLNEFAVIGGIAAAILTVIVHRRFSDNSSDPDRANPWQFGELSARRDYLEASYLAYCCNDNKPLEASGVAACTDARIQIDQIALELDVPTIVLDQAVCVGSSGYDKKRRAGSSDKWLLGTGFVELWQRLHAAEAALLNQRPLEQRLSYAGHDSLRLSGCEMSGVEDLQADLDLAVKTLDEIQKEGSSVARAPEVQRATEVLITVHKAIDDYRDQSRAGLARTRVHLIMAGLVTGILAFVLLAVAILDDVAPYQVIAGGAYFLVGAVAGLIWQLRQSGSTIRSGEDDFGLDHARLVYVPVLSGLAGVGGVLLIAMLNAVLDVNSGELADSTVPELSQIFNLYTNRFGLVVAAVFGLTPDLLINRLQGEADKYKTELAATSPQTRSDELVPSAFVDQIARSMDERFAKLAENLGLPAAADGQGPTDSSTATGANGKTDTADGTASNQVTENTEVIAVGDPTGNGQAAGGEGTQGADPANPDIGAGTTRTGGVGD